MTSKARIPESTQVIDRLQQRMKVARGDQPANLVIRNAQWLDVFTGGWQRGDVAIFDGVIVGVSDSYDAVHVIDAKGGLLVPGFIDAHVHVESSMMTPKQFLRAVLPRGTTAVIWDPHEIANVKGVRGIQWALDSTESLPLDFFVMVPSCVPSTSAPMQLETSGAELSASDILHFAKHPRVLGLAEMMNWPGLVGGDREVMEKLVAFQDKKRDGHCPGLTGKLLNAYGVAGIHSCHESTTKAEAREKLTKGIHVLIREGSCAKDADELLPLLDAWTSATVGLCSDDRNPLDIEESGHLDCIINKGLISGIEPAAVFRAASFSVAKMYGLDDRGAIAPGYRADLVLVQPVAKKKANAIDFSQGITVTNVWRGGVESSSLLETLFSHDSSSVSSSTLASNSSDPFSAEKNLHIKSKVILASDFKISATRGGPLKARVIGVLPGKIVTESLVLEVDAKNGQIMADAAKGINKIAVIERHHETGRMATGLVFGLNLKSGAIATSINHDCHNVIVTGSSDEFMAEAVAQLRKIDGGIVVVGEGGASKSIALPIGGLMTNDLPEMVASRLRELKKLAKKIGCLLEEPFLQISFLALPVIPNLKITDRGLVDGSKFEIVTVELI
jgi:adenine deaminase